MSSIYFIISIYVISILLGSVVTTLKMILAAQERNDINRNLRSLSLVLLFFVLCEFFVFYQISSGVGDRALLAMMLLSNICYYVFVYLWIRLLYLLSGLPMRRALYLAVIAAYAAGGELAGWLNIEHDPTASYFQIREGIWHDLLSAADAAFALWIFYIAIRFFLHAWRRMPADPRRRGVLAYSAILFLYMIWVMMWDYQMINGRKIDISDLFAMDPMVAFYIIYCIASIWLFLRKDPLGIGVVVSAENHSLELAANEYGLTEREKEVLEQVCRGYSNPVIGENLFIAENTVKRHLNVIFKKTDTKGRYELLSLMNKYK